MWKTHQAGDFQGQGLFSFIGHFAANQINDNQSAHCVLQPDKLVCSVFDEASAF